MQDARGDTCGEWTVAAKEQSVCVTSTGLQWARTVTSRRSCSGACANEFRLIEKAFRSDGASALRVIEKTALRRRMGAARFLRCVGSR